MDGYLDENVNGGYMYQNERYLDGYMIIAAGLPAHEYIDSATRHTQMFSQLIHGNKVKTPLPDVEVIHIPKDDFPSSYPKEVKEE